MADFAKAKAGSTDAKATRATTKAGTSDTKTETKATETETKAKADDMPETAAERVEWIGQDHTRAQRALDDERSRGGEARSTVVEHAEGILIPVIEVKPDPTTSPDPFCSVHGRPPAECADLHPELRATKREVLAGGHVIATDPVPEARDEPVACEVHGGPLDDCAKLHDNRAGWAVAEPKG